MKTLPRGFWSGLIATAQMTQFLYWGFRRLPRVERSPLPPAALNRDVGRKAGLPPPGREASENHAMLSHFLFGVGCATAYAVLQARRRDQNHPVAEGLGFGVLVWASTYVTGIPALGLRPSVFQLSANQNALTFASHLVWGASLGTAERALREKSGRMLDGRRAFTPLPARQEAS